MEKVNDFQGVAPFNSQFAVSDVANLLASPSEDGYVYVWYLSDALAGKPLSADTAIAKLECCPPVWREGSLDPSGFLYLAFSPDGKLLAMPKQGTILLETTTFTQVARVPYYNVPLIYS